MTQSESVARGCGGMRGGGWDWYSASYLQFHLSPLLLWILVRVSHGILGVGGKGNDWLSPPVQLAVNVLTAGHWVTAGWLWSLCSSLSGPCIHASKKCLGVTVFVSPHRRPSDPSSQVALCSSYQGWSESLLSLQYLGSWLQGCSNTVGSVLLLFLWLFCTTFVTSLSNRSSSWRLSAWVKPKVNLKRFSRWQMIYVMRFRRFANGVHVIR